MNDDQLKGTIRNVTGKIEQGAGDIAGKPGWQAEGIVDQIAGSAQSAYGSVKDAVRGAIDDAPALADRGGEAVRATAEQAKDAAKRGGEAVRASVEDSPVLWAAAAAIGAYALAWAIHGRHD